MRPGVRLGVDVGSVRIGLAASDPGGIMATPVETVPRGEGDLARIAALAAERAAVEVVVGLPRGLSGVEGAAAEQARGFARRLAARVAPVPVRLVDERLSTVSAQRDLRESGVAGRRGRRMRRTVLDQAAAVVILQSALDAERGTGRPPGQPAGGPGMPGAAQEQPEQPEHEARKPRKPRWRAGTSAGTRGGRTGGRSAGRDEEVQ